MKNKFNVNNNTVYYSRKQARHHHRSITNLSTIRQELLKTFLIVIMCMLSTAMAQSTVNSNTSKPIDCKALSTSSLSYQLYDYERFTMSKLKYNSFIQKCKSHPSDEDELNDLIYSYRNYLSPSSVAHSGFNLFIFDFRVIKNDLVYVDFLNYENYTKTTATNAINDSCSQTNLVLYFATQQFTLFKLLNVPSKSSNCLQSITILLHGKSQLNFVQKKENSIPVNVINSPIYYSIESESIESENIESASRTYWIDYLTKSFGSDKKFIENLFVFCHISHIQIDLAKLLNIHMNSHVQDTSYVQYLTQMKLNFNEMANLIQRCEINGDIENNQLLSTSSQSPISYDSSLPPASLVINKSSIKTENIYLFEMYQNNNDEYKNYGSQNIYIFIRQCSKYEKFLLVFYSHAKQKRIVLDGFKCNIKIYSNIKVVNRFGNEYDTLQTISNLNETSIPKDYQPLKNYYSALILAKQIEHDANIRLDAFNYLQINASHQQIELSFISKYDISDVPERLSNNLNYQTFAERNFYLLNANSTVDFSNLKRENCSIRFVVHATHLIEYFNQTSISLKDFMVSCKNNDCFFITKSTCRAFSLSSDYSQLEKGKSFLIFNSNLFYNSSTQGEYNPCFYFDKFTKNFYLTFAFNVNHTEHIESNHLTVNHYFNLEKFKQKQFSVLDKSVSSNDYFNSLIDFTRDSDYSVYTRVNWQKRDDYTLNYLAEKFITNISNRQSDRDFYSFEFNTKIKLNAIDHEVSWSLDSCWLGNDTCATNIQNDMLDLKNFDEYYYENADDYVNDNEYTANENDFNSNPKINVKSNEEASGKRFKRNNANSQNAHLLYTSNTIFTYNQTSKLYEIHLNITLNGYNVKNLQNSRFFYCYLKPFCPICEYTSKDKSVSKCDLKVCKYFINKVDPSKYKTILVGKFNMSANETSLLESKLDIESSQIKHNYTCTNLNFPFNLNKHTLKTELFSTSQQFANLPPSTTRKTSTRFSNVTKVTEKAVEWLDHNKMTTILIFLILVVVVVMVCVGLKLCLPRNFFHPESAHKEEENNFNDIPMIEITHTIPNRNHSPNDTHSSLISPVLTNKVQAEQKMKLLTVNTNVNHINRKEYT